MPCSGNQFSRREALYGATYQQNECRESVAALRERERQDKDDQGAVAFQKSDVSITSIHHLPLRCQRLLQLLPVDESEA